MSIQYRVDIDIQAFKTSDYPEVKDIYQQGIDTGNATFQEKAKDWEAWKNAGPLAGCGFARTAKPGCRCLALDRP